MNWQLPTPTCLYTTTPSHMALPTCHGLPPIHLTGTPMPHTVLPTYPFFCCATYTHTCLPPPCLTTDISLPPPLHQFTRCGHSAPPWPPRDVPVPPPHALHTTAVPSPAFCLYPHCYASLYLTSLPAPDILHLTWATVGNSGGGGAFKRYHHHREAFLHLPHHTCTHTTTPLFHGQAPTKKE